MKKMRGVEGLSDIKMNGTSGKIMCHDFEYSNNYKNPKSLPLVF